MYGCIDYFTSYLQWNALLTCVIFQKFFDSKMHQIWVNWGIYKLFLCNTWDKEVMLCITCTFPFWSLNTLYVSSIFLQQPVSNFDLYGNFYKPLRNIYDMSGRVDNVVLCNRVIEFTSQLWETKVIPSPHLCFFNRMVPFHGSSRGGSGGFHIIALYTVCVTKKPLSHFFAKIYF